MKINVIENGKVITRDMTEKEEIEFSENQPIDTRTYGEIVNDLIREKYSLSEELALLRQSETKSDEFLEYYNYAEECKSKAKENRQ